MLKNPLKPGVYAPEGYFDAAAFFAEAEKRKFRVTKSFEYLD
jgi:hypothetical protein